MLIIGLLKCEIIVNHITKLMLFAIKCVILNHSSTLYPYYFVLNKVRSWVGSGFGSFNDSSYLLNFKE